MDKDHSHGKVRDFYEKVRSSGYEEGHDDGKGEGFQEGYGEGLLTGEDSGRDRWYREGYQEGYEQGFESGYDSCKFFREIEEAYADTWEERQKVTGYPIERETS